MHLTLKILGNYAVINFRTAAILDPLSVITAANLLILTEFITLSISSTSNCSICFSSVKSFIWYKYSCRLGVKITKF